MQDLFAPEVALGMPVGSMQGLGPVAMSSMDQALMQMGHPAGPVPANHMYGFEQPRGSGATLSSHRAVQVSPLIKPGVLRVTGPPSCASCGLYATTPASGGTLMVRAVCCGPPAKLFARQKLTLMVALQPATPAAAVQAGLPAAAAYQASSLVVRLSLKIFNCTPGELPQGLRDQLCGWLCATPAGAEGYIRPGCVHLTVMVGSPRWCRYQAVRNLPSPSCVVAEVSADASLQRAQLTQCSSTAAALNSDLQRLRIGAYCCTTQVAVQ